MPTSTSVLIQFSFLALFLVIFITFANYLATSFNAADDKRFAVIFLCACIGAIASRGFYLAWKTFAIKK